MVEKPKEINMGRNKKGDFYSLDDILKYDATYNFIIGMRGNGKTFACLEYILDQYLQKGKAGAIIRRYELEIVGNKGMQMFSAFVSNSKGNLIEKKTGGKWNDFIYKNRQFTLCKKNRETGEIENYDMNAFAYTFAISQQEHYKSISYPTIYTALFDEVITRDGYLENEFVDFQNLLSTIIRDKEGFKIFMCANTINKYCPYFDEMGLNHVKEQAQGTIDLYTYGNGNLKVAVEYAEVLTKIKKVNDMYFAFDNPRLKMITEGAWEIDIYPHLPYKYNVLDVVFKFFIEFDKELFTGEVISNNDEMWAFIHKKTTPITETEYPVYTTKIVTQRNYTRKFFKPKNKAEELVLKIYQKEQFYYQDNSIGETLRNFLMWSESL